MDGHPLPETVGLRLFAAPDAGRTADLHLQELSNDFVTRFGRRFVERYHRAFARSPYATVLVADDYATGRVVGALLGTFDTPAHYGWLVRRHGAGLSLWAGVQAVRHPALARDLIKTRAARYTRGLARSLTSVERPPKPGDKPEENPGLLAHVMVDGERRGNGIGLALVRAYENRAKDAGLGRLQLATLADHRGAGPFYEKIGWQYAGEKVSQSDESFSIYTRTLPDKT